MPVGKTFVETKRTDEKQGNAKESGFMKGRETINGAVAQSSCKQNIPKMLCDVSGNRAKEKSQGARNIDLALDNIKAQIINRDQKLYDREALVTAETGRNAYQGIASEYETLIRAFDKRTDMSMLELTSDFIKKFAACLTAERGLKNVPIWLTACGRKAW